MLVFGFTLFREYRRSNGCIYACTCTGRCYDCSEYKKEEYIGHAEDLLAQANGYETADEWNRESEKTKKYNRQQKKNNIIGGENENKKNSIRFCRKNGRKIKR